MKILNESMNVEVQIYNEWIRCYNDVIFPISYNDL